MDKLSLVHVIALRISFTRLLVNVHHNLLPGLKIPTSSVAPSGNANIQAAHKKPAASRIIRQAHDHAAIDIGAPTAALIVAKAALFLASDDARYITGIELVVDGGFTSRTQFAMNRPAIVPQGPP